MSYGSDIVDVAPINYDFLPAEKQEKIIDYVTNLSKELYKHTYASHICTVADLRNMHANQASDYGSRLKGFVDGLEEIGIYLRFNWPRHREEWFLCTLEDIQMAEDYDMY